jgi:hypothetical protein
MMDDKNFIKRVFLGAFIWHIIKYFFRYPIRILIIVTVIYFGGRYMLFNHPDMIRNGLDAAKEEMRTVGEQISKVVNG